MLKVVLALVVVPCVLGKTDSANLRGKAEETKAAAASSSQQQGHPAPKRSGKSPVMNNMERNAGKHNEAVSAHFDEVRNKALSPQQGDKKPAVKAHAGPKLLDNGLPDPTYDSFLVSRKRLGADCKGAVESLVATNMACVKSGAQSMAGYCSQDEYYSYVNFTIYDDDDCSGNVVGYTTEQYSRGCHGDGYTYQCISRNDLPPFVQKQGLYTYDFHDNSKCQNFASTYLGYNPRTTYTQFDDEAGQDDDGGNFDDVQACCLPSELADYCPYPTCGSDDDGGDSGPPPPPTPSAVHNQHTPVVGLNTAAQSAEASVATAPAATTSTATTAGAAAASAERPPLWWQSTAGRRAVHLQAKQAKQASPPKESKQTKQTTLGENPVTSYAREYSLTQQRNDACYFDEKYQLWVKTSCHGKRNELIHTLFADEQCTLAMKKSVHVLSDVVDNYGYCVSNYAYTRGKLVVCRNEDGVANPFGFNSGGVS